MIGASIARIDALPSYPVVAFRVTHAHLVVVRDGFRFNPDPDVPHAVTSPILQHRPPVHHAQPVEIFFPARRFQDRLGRVGPQGLQPRLGVAQLVQEIVVEHQQRLARRQRYGLDRLRVDSVPLRQKAAGEEHRPAPAVHGQALGPHARFIVEQRGVVQPFHGLRVGESLAQPFAVIGHGAGQTHEGQMDGAVGIGPEPRGVRQRLLEPRVQRRQMLVQVPLAAVVVAVLDIVHVVGVRDDDLASVRGHVGVMTDPPHLEGLALGHSSRAQIVQAEGAIEDPEVFRSPDRVAAGAVRVDGDGRRMILDIRVQNGTRPRAFAGHHDVNPAGRQFQKAEKKRTVVNWHEGARPQMPCRVRPGLGRREKLGLPSRFRCQAAQRPHRILRTAHVYPDGIGPSQPQASTRVRP